MGDFIHPNKTISYYNTPVIKQVPPLRHQIIHNLTRDVRNGKYSQREIAKIQAMIDKKHLMYKTKVIEPKDFKQNRQKLQMFENPHFKDIYQAMQIGRQELEELVNKRREVILDSKPMLFGEVYSDADPHTRWLLLKQTILSKVSNVS